jgi:prepilin-type N-terminal cleavage/methylation domain-containing protein
MNKPNAESGFSMIEMAMVLAIIGLLMGGGLLAITPVLERNKRTQTFQSLDKIEEALTLYVIRNNRLPCPANGSLANTDANYGAALTTGAAGTSCNLANRALGVVPWRTLGIEQAIARDGWGNLISYFVSDNQVLTFNVANNQGVRRDPALTNQYTCGTLLVNNAATPAAALSPNNATGVCNASATENAAYVLVSHGKNGAGACCSAAGALKTGSPTAGTSEAANNDGATPFVQNDFIQIPGNTYFDDIVRWRTAAYIVQACGSGACGNP